MILPLVVASDAELFTPVTGDAEAYTVPIGDNQTNEYFTSPSTASPESPGGGGGGVVPKKENISEEKVSVELEEEKGINYTLIGGAGAGGIALVFSSLFIFRRKR